MKQCRLVHLIFVLGLPYVGPVPVRAAEQKSPAFQVRYTPQVSSKPFTGRVFLILSPTALTEPPRQPNWFKPAPFFAQDVKSWKAGDKLEFMDNCLSYPGPLSSMKKGTYYAMAVMDFDRGGVSFAAAEGNGYSKAVRVDLDSDASHHYDLTIDQVFHEKPFKETERIKLVEIESKLLTAFHGRPIHLRAAVVLPRSYAEHNNDRYPVIYDIPGFGGTHNSAVFAVIRNATNVAGTEMLYVVLDPSCRLGHHVFADSDNNGPYGQALVEELIPEIEKRCRTIALPNARYLTGHSSGGWSSLWLQITYPDFFGGVWSTAPDPVDFRDFQHIDLYKPGVNMFKDVQGKDRPLARLKETPVLFYQPFSDMEIVMGHGGQLGSFESVFSPRGTDGKPRPLWNRANGEVDPEVAKSWQRYDIRLKLERNWPSIGPKLAGKLHIICGGLDTFYLEGAVSLLKESLAKLGSDAVVEIVPGKDHRTVVTPSLRDRIAREMAAKARQIPALQAQ